MLKSREFKISYILEESQVSIIEKTEKFFKETLDRKTITSNIVFISTIKITDFNLLVDTRPIKYRNRVNRNDNLNDIIVTLIIII